MNKKIRIVPDHYSNLTFHGKNLNARSASGDFPLLGRMFNLREPYTFPTVEDFVPLGGREGGKEICLRVQGGRGRGEEGSWKTIARTNKISESLTA